MAGEKETYISVIGSSECDKPVAEKAYEVGAEIAGSGCVLVSGGLTGVMEASCKGAHEANGRVIAIVPGTIRSEANRYADYVVASGIGHARNLAVVATGDVVIAVGGKWGTLSEIGLARGLDRQVVLLDSWSLSQSDLGTDGLHISKSAVSAVRMAIKLA